MKVLKMQAILILALALTLGVSGSVAGAAPKTFKDVSASFWAKKEIDYLTEREVISGYADGRFGTQDPITRAQAAAMLIRTFGWGDLSNQPDPGYPDVSPKHWAYYEIAAMKNAGFYAPEGSFQTEKKVTRAEMADMLVRTFSLTSPSGAKFADLDRSHWAYDAINILATNRITTGYEDGTFRPDRLVTRAEFAVFVSRAMEESFRPAVPAGKEDIISIYDLEIGDQYYQMETPLMLAEDWLAPAELYEKMGYQVNETDKDHVYLTTNEGMQIELSNDNDGIWVGDVLVELSDPVHRIGDELYINSYPILKALEKPLVFYPEQRLIRLESPRVTVQDIKRNAPESILNVIHGEAPYWHWAKKDHDYLAKLLLTGIQGKEVQLRKEMAQLSEAFLQLESKKTVIKGLNYYDDHLTGKLDAVSRGIEARYLLLTDPKNYQYPAVGKSGSTGYWSYSYVDFDYVVSDFSYDHLTDRKEELIQFIQSNDELSFEKFKGLNIYGIPFSIREIYPDGTRFAWSGQASGTETIVIGSSLGTFIHEFGHIWDYKFGDEEAYLKLRGKEDYNSGDEWAELIGENFAEDFTAAYKPEDSEFIHKAVFGEPSEESKASFREWVKNREQQYGEVQPYAMTMNGAALLPKVLVVHDNKLHFEGEAGFEISGGVENIATGNNTPIELSTGSGSFNQTVTLPGPGIYKLAVGKFNSTIIYP